MMMKNRNRNRYCNAGCSCCDPRMAPKNIKSYRRAMRRIEKNRWMRELDFDNNN